jgi:hypothetical protein
VAGMGGRWADQSQVGEFAESLASRAEVVAETLVSAAWVHDIGYSPRLVVEGPTRWMGLGFSRDAAYRGRGRIGGAPHRSGI